MIFRFLCHVAPANAINFALTSLCIAFTPLCAADASFFGSSLTVLLRVLLRTPQCPLAFQIERFVFFASYGVNQLPPELYRIFLEVAFDRLTNSGPSISGNDASMLLGCPVAGLRLISVTSCDFPPTQPLNTTPFPEAAFFGRVPDGPVNSCSLCYHFSESFRVLLPISLIKHSIERVQRFFIFFFSFPVAPTFRLAAMRICSRILEIGDDPERRKDRFSCHFRVPVRGGLPCRVAGRARTIGKVG